MENFSKLRRLSERTVYLCVFFLLLVLLWMGCASAATERVRQGETEAHPPPQPSRGPGSGAYSHAQVTKSQHGQGALMYWLYQPGAPTPASAPVVLFLHGLDGIDPYFYGGWIDHIVRRGTIVIYPVYQTSILQSTKEMLGNAIQASSDAIDHLTRSSLVRPQLQEFAILGHSFGGGLTVQIAARAEKVRLPMPKAIMAVQPGWKGSKQMPADELTEIPRSVLMLIVDGDEDQFAQTRQGKTIFCRTHQILPDRKKYVVLQSDYHGSPPLIADHSSPLAPQEDYGMGTSPRREKRRKFIMRLMGMRNGEADALDYFGYWRLFDTLFDAALRGKNIDAVIGSERDLSMGQWSDGTSIKPLQGNAPQCAP